MSPPILGPDDHCRVCGSSTEALHLYEPATLLRCGACDFVFQPVTEQAALEIYDDEYFAQYAAGGASYEDAAPQRRFESACRIHLLHEWARPPGALLEIGSAYGYFLDAARRAGWEVLGVEPSQTAVSASRRLFPQIDVLVGFVEHQQLPAETFSAAVGWHVLEHIPQPVEMLSLVRRALRPGAVAIVEVPNFASVQARRLGTAWRPLEPDHHLNYFTPSSLRTTFERAGFHVADMHTVSQFAYQRRLTWVRPRAAFRRARYAKRSHTVPTRRHAHKHDFLRAVAKA